MYNNLEIIYYIDSPVILTTLYNWKFRTESLLALLSDTNKEPNIRYKAKLNTNVGLIKLFIVDIDSGLNKFIALIVDDKINHLVDMKVYKDLHLGYLKYLVTDPDLLGSRICLPYKEIALDIKQHFNLKELSMEACNDGVEKLFIRNGAELNKYKTMLNI